MAVTGLTRNQFIGFSRYEGSNPSVSAFAGIGFPMPVIILTICTTFQYQVAPNHTFINQAVMKQACKSIQNMPAHEKAMKEYGNGAHL